MRFCTLLLTVALIVGLCVSAGATRIYTSAGGDGTIELSRQTYYDAGQGGVSDYYSPVATSGTSLAVYGSDSVLQFNHDAYQEWTSLGYAVMIFPLAGVSGAVIPENTRMWFYGTLSDDASDADEWAWWHGNVELGPNVVENQSPLKGGVDLFAYQAPQSGSATWMFIDVTAQLQEDINRGYNYSTFILGASSPHMSMNAISGTIGSSEGGYGAYLEMVPEPGSLATLLVGMSSIAGFAWRRRRSLP